MSVGYTTGRKTASFRKGGEMQAGLLNGYGAAIDILVYV